MANALSKVPFPVNEPILSYKKGSSERALLQTKLTAMGSGFEDIPIIIGGKEIRTGNTEQITAPHDHSKKLGIYHKAGTAEVKMAIEASLKAKKEWAEVPWEQRISVFLKAAELLTGKWRPVLNAATMLGQSKVVHQAEIDSACELIDFWRFNSYFLTQIMADQPYSPKGLWNRSEYRPLEGFVFAVTPFNFTSIAGNLPTAPAIAGNTAIWKPASSSVYTGSTSVFKSMWKRVGDNIDRYKYYPRIIGETGGKDFIFAHNKADVKALATAALRGAFEYQGQKCSAASRMYIPNSIFTEFRDLFCREVSKITIGNPEDFTNFMSAVIDKSAFSGITSYIDYAKKSSEAEIITGGGYDDKTGYFIEPTTIVTTNPNFKTMEEEIFGPVLTIYVYEDSKFEETLELCDKTSPYALTGCIWSQDRYALNLMTQKLVNAAGNFYINDKPTAAVVGQQPFGGARASGTNDKAGSILNMVRWLSPRSIKETLEPPYDWKYPFMEE